MLDLAALFDDPDFFDVDPKNQIEIIRQRAGHVWEILLQKKRRRDREKRRACVLSLAQEDLPIAEIAMKAGLSRQAVYKIIKKDK
jgi:DNA invertase Pin-like site-specific DNA recombinase